MKKLLAILMIFSLLTFVVSCGCQEENPGDDTNENGDVYEDKDGDGYSDVFDDELPIIPLN